MNIKIRLILFTALAMLCVNFLKAQVCGLSNLQIDELVKTTELVVTGKVVDKHSFWNNAQTNIYTQHTIEVKQSSNFSTNKIYVITEGGTVNDISFQIFGTPSLTLKSEGVFFLNKNYTVNKKDEVYYNLIDVAFYNSTTNTIESKSSICAVSNFNKMLNQTHQTSFLFTKNEQKMQKVKQAIITGISPSKIIADNSEILTITGNGFGSFRGSAKISMRDADNINTSAYVNIDAANIKSWTNNKIQFVVPGDEITSDFPGVASGKIKLTDQFGVVTTSSKTVEVRYNKKVYTGTSIRIRAKDRNSSIPFYVERKLINNGALQAIKNALETWNCTTGSNFTYGGIIDNVCRTYDEINVICYDNTIPSLTLAITRVIARKCTDTNIADQMDADITINPNLNWSYNDNLASGQYHFESVLLHEIGHAFMLSHVQNTTDVMYPLLRNGLLKNELTDNDMDGGLDVMRISTSSISCSSFGPVISNSSANCRGCANVTNINAKNFTKNSVYLSWDKVRNSVAYSFRYRYNGSRWYQYKANSNDAILFDLPPCTTIECRLSTFCNNYENSESETIYRFTTLGCLN